MVAELLFKVRADTGNTTSALSRLIAPLTKIGKQSDQASKSLDKLGKADVTPKVETGALDKAISKAEADLKHLRDQLVEEVTLGVDTRATTTAIRRVESNLKLLRQQRTQIPVTVNTTQASGALARLKTAVAGIRAGLGTGLSKVGSGLQSLGSGVSSFFSNLNVPLVGALGVGITALGVAAVKSATGMVMLADTMENNRIAFETLLGSGKRADTFLRDLQKFAASTPFEFTELVGASKKLLAFGFSGSEIIPLLTKIGDAAGNTGADVEALAVIFGQMRAKGKLATEDILQLVEAGIPAWDILAEKLGKSKAEVMKLAEQGKLTGKAFRDLQEGVAEKFGGGMEKQAKTLSGQLSNLSDTWEQIKTKIGDAFLPFAKAIVPLLQTGLENFGKAVTNSLPNLADSIESFANMLIDLPSKIIAGLKVTVTGILTAVAQIQSGLGTFLVSMGDLVGRFASVIMVLAPLLGVAFDTKSLVDAAAAAKTAGEGMLQASQNTQAAAALAGAQLDRWASAYAEAAAKAKTAVSGAKAAFALNVSTDKAQAKVDAYTQKLKALGKLKPSPKVDAQTSAAKAKLDKANAWLRQLNRYKANPTLLARDLASGKVAVVKGKLVKLDQAKAKPDIVAEDKTGPGVHSAKQNLASVKDKTVTITVRRKTRGTTADIGPQPTAVAVSAVPVATTVVTPAPQVVLSLRDEALAQFLDVRINGQAVAAARVLHRRDVIHL